MEHLVKPTAKLPNKRLIVEEEFIEAVVNTINGILDDLKKLHDDISTLSTDIHFVDRARKEAIRNEAYIRQKTYDTLANNLAKTNEAVTRMSEAVNIILGGKEQ